MQDRWVNQYLGFSFHKEICKAALVFHLKYNEPSSYNRPLLELSFMIKQDCQIVFITMRMCWYRKPKRQKRVDTSFLVTDYRDTGIKWSFNFLLLVFSSKMCMDPLSQPMCLEPRKGCTLSSQVSFGCHAVWRSLLHWITSAASRWVLLCNGVV